MNKDLMKFLLGALTLTITGSLLLSACNDTQGTPATLNAQGNGNTYYSEARPLGQGEIRSYLQVAQSGRPLEIGVTFNAAALEQLPHHPMENGHCFDMNADGTVDPHMECALGMENVLPFPKEATTLAKTPFKYAMVNFNAMGHQPPGIYDVPHFDFHFYMQSNEARENIRLGPCAEVVNCDDMVTAQKPLAPEYAPADYVDVGAVMGKMGNHLLDVTHSPEFNGHPFTHTWIWGTYDARITFFEPMITLAYLNTQPEKDCTSYTMPSKFHEAGFYPTQYCTSYNKGLKQYTVSLENFKWYGN